jgi:hypothetical protein
MRFHLESTDIALVSVFCALRVTLNKTPGPLSFRLFSLPILCDFAVFFSLLPVTWMTEKFGIVAIIITLPMIGILERAHMREIKSAR